MTIGNYGYGSWNVQWSNGDDVQNNRFPTREEAEQFLQKCRAKPHDGAYHLMNDDD